MCVEARRIVLSQMAQRFKIQERSKTDEQNARDSQPITIMNLEQKFRARPKGSDTKNILCAKQKIAYDFISTICVCLCSIVRVVPMAPGLEVFTRPDDCPTNLKQRENNLRK